MLIFLFIFNIVFSLFNIIKAMDNLPKLKINVISNSIRNTLSNNHDDCDYLLENDNYIENYLENLPEAPQPEALITNLLPYQKQGFG